MEQLYKKYLNSTGISTDTRKIEKGNLFFALKGPNFNGNKFADKALEEGAAYVIVDEIHAPLSENQEEVVLVGNVLNALQELAQYHRRQLNIPIIAVGGSNGKLQLKNLFTGF